MKFPHSTSAVTPWQNSKAFTVLNGGYYSLWDIGAVIQHGWYPFTELPSGRVVWSDGSLSTISTDTTLKLIR